MPASSRNVFLFKGNLIALEPMNLLLQSTQGSRGVDEELIVKFKKVKDQ